MKKIIQLKLKIAAKLILAKYKPRVVGITGSVGKTSAKEAVYAVLKDKFRTRQSIKNYNNEIGVPLTIIGIDSPGRSLSGWIKAAFRAGWLLLRRDQDYPEILVLEMGVDRPGDMDYLNSIVKCDVGIITMIGHSHAEFFGRKDKIKAEKAKLIENINPGGWAIFNYDCRELRQAVKAPQAKTLNYGLDEKADINAGDTRFNFEKEQGKLKGLSFKLGYRGESAEASVPEAAGRTAVYAALAGAACGLAFDIKLSEIAGQLKKFIPPRGRMNIIPGIKNSLIIDDTYNSSPESCGAALDVFKLIPLKSGSRRIAVLGDMLELGKYTEKLHQDAGKRVFLSGIDKLIIVGERARDIGHGARAAGMKPDNIFHFSDSESAGRFIQERIRPGDLLLVKGSQGMRMEKIVKEIMADPLKAKDLLVRQEDKWLV